MTATGKHDPPGTGSVRDSLDATPEPGAAQRDELLRLDRALSSELARLEDEFGETLTDDVVHREFESCVRSFASARIRLYVPVLSYRNARQALRARTLTLDVGGDDDLLGPSLDRSRPAATVPRRGARARRR